MVVELPVWIDKEGNSHNIKEMTDKHIINSIKWLTNDPSFGELKKQDIRDITWVSMFSRELLHRTYENMKDIDDEQKQNNHT